MNLRLVRIVGVLILLAISGGIGYILIINTPSVSTQVSQNNELIATPENLKNLGLNFKEMSVVDPQRSRLITKDQAVIIAYQSEPNLKNAVRFSARLGMIQSDTQVVLKNVRPVWLITFHGIESTSSGPPGSPHSVSDEYTVVIDAQKGEYLFAFPLFDITPQPLTTSGLINRQAAIDAALKIASSSMPEVSGALVTPQVVQAHQMTLGDALRLHQDTTPMNGYSSDTLVWVVILEGLWASEANAPDATPSITQQPFHSYTIILDAKTGLEIGGSLRP